MPGGRRISRLASQTFVELTFPVAAHFAGLMSIEAITPSGVRTADGTEHTA